jgi:hypothetical protein
MAQGTLEVFAVKDVGARAEQGMIELIGGRRQVPDLGAQFVSLAPHQWLPRRIATGGQEHLDLGQAEAGWQMATTARVFRTSA